jgi:glycosyltransferase involved in cell wall biosynthesis
MLIDVTRLVDRQLQGMLPTGVDRVSLQYVSRYGADALALIRYAGRWLILNKIDSAGIFADLLTVPENFAWRVRWLVAKYLLLPMPRGLAGRQLLNTGHSGLDKPDYGLRIKQYGLKAVLFVHDLIPITHPEYCRPGEDERHRRRVDTVLTHGHAIVVNSRFTGDVLQAYADHRQLPVPPWVVAPLASPRWPVRAEPTPLDTPYFVMLGTIEPRKNHLLILHVWRELVERLGKRAPRLVLIGQRGWECENVVDMLDRCEAMRGYVIEHPTCPDADLHAWLKHARALLFPSFVEGFGMPLVEALGLGLPVIASDLPAFREVAGNIPDYVSPIDGAGWMAMVTAYMLDECTQRQAQIERMADFQAPTWEAHFAAVDRLLEEVGAGQ